MARIYDNLETKFTEGLLQQRILFISFEKDSVTRVSEVSAHRRNKYVKSLADEMKTISNS